jgi:hypothetical protein
MNANISSVLHLLVFEAITDERLILTIGPDEEGVTRS